MGSWACKSFSLSLSSFSLMLGVEVANGGRFLFISTILNELGLIRQRRKESRFSPMGTMPGAWADGPAAAAEDEKKAGGAGGRGFWGWLFGRKKKGGEITPLAPNPDALPGHALPEDVRRSQAMEEASPSGMVEQEGWGGFGRGGNAGYGRGEGAGYGQRDSLGYDIVGAVDGDGTGYQHGRQGHAGGGDLGHGLDRLGADRTEQVPLARYPPANYRYSDGVYGRV